MNSQTSNSPGRSRLLPSLALLAAVLWLGAAPAPAQTVLVTPLHAFDSPGDGSNPHAALLLGPNSALFGTTFNGGTTNNSIQDGVVFRINPAGSGHTILHAFTNGLADGAHPFAGLLWATDGSLYGTSYEGGTNGNVFRINADGTGFALVHSFAGTDGSAPRAPLIQGPDGALYGTAYGGPGSAGVVFKLNLDGSGFQVLHAFTNTPDGNAPFGGLMLGPDGALYGTTVSGGTNGFGTIYRIQTDGNNSQILHSFAGGSDGQSPMAALCQASDGLLYGTTSAGGTNGVGTVFLLTTNGSGFKVMHTFQGQAGNDGGTAVGSLVQAWGNEIYGTTGSGGTNNAGTIFRFAPGGGGYQVAYSFSGGNDGSDPLAGLVPGAASGGSGVLYGTTQNGGAHAQGTVYAVVVNPPLSITPVVGQSGTNPPLVFWPAWAVNYQLQSTTNLSAGNWAPATNGALLMGFQATNAGPAGFYRLVAP